MPRDFAFPAAPVEADEASSVAAEAVVGTISGAYAVIAIMSQFFAIRCIRLYLLCNLERLLLNCCLRRTFDTFCRFSVRAAARAVLANLLRSRLALRAVFFSVRSALAVLLPRMARKRLAAAGERCA